MLIYKIRVQSSDMKKGKRGAFRTIYYVLSELDEVILLTIYAKSRQENILAERITEILKTLN